MSTCSLDQLSPVDTLKELFASFQRVLFGSQAVEIEHNKKRVVYGKNNLHALVNLYNQLYCQYKNDIPDDVFLPERLSVDERGGPGTVRRGVPTIAQYV